MSYRVRPATGEDYKAIYQMAKLTGGGFTNLPPDRQTLVAKLDKSEKSFSRKEDTQTGDLFMFVLEDPKAGKIRGTCQVFGQVGRQPALLLIPSEHASPSRARSSARRSATRC